jgi:hypothetical protein
LFKFNRCKCKFPYYGNWCEKIKTCSCKCKFPYYGDRCEIKTSCAC